MKAILFSIFLAATTAHAASPSFLVTGGGADYDDAKDDVISRAVEICLPKIAKQVSEFKLHLAPGNILHVAAAQFECSEK